jgi:hypothetical protein
MRGRGGEQARGLTALDAAPELLLRREQEVLVERIGRNRDLDPFSAPVSRPSRLGKGPGQHEFGLEDRPAAGDDAVKRRTHPPEHLVPEPMLHAFDGLPGVALVPMPVEGFSREAELDDEVAGEVLRLGLAPLFPPEAQEGRFIGAHDDPSVRTADETASIEIIARK